jgi:hypothetical protein
VVTLSSGFLHVVELKVLKGRKLAGPAQLSTYMKHKRRDEGWLVLFDTREHYKRDAIPATISTEYGIVRTVIIDVNPLAPSKKDERG